MSRIGFGLLSWPLLGSTRFDLPCFQNALGGLFKEFVLLMLFRLSFRFLLGLLVLGLCPRGDVLGVAAAARQLVELRFALTAILHHIINKSRPLLPYDKHDQNANSHASNTQFLLTNPPLYTWNDSSVGEVNSMKTGVSIYRASYL